MRTSCLAAGPLSTEPLALQYLVIGLTLSFTDFVVMSGYSALASSRSAVA